VHTQKPYYVELATQIYAKHGFGQFVASPYLNFGVLDVDSFFRLLSSKPFFYSVASLLNFYSDRGLSQGWMDDVARAFGVSKPAPPRPPPEFGLPLAPASSPAGPAPSSPAGPVQSVPTVVMPDANVAIGQIVHIMLLAGLVEPEATAVATKLASKGWCDDEIPSLFDIGPDQLRNETGLAGPKIARVLAVLAKKKAGQI